MATAMGVAAFEDTIVMEEVVVAMVECGNGNGGGGIRRHHHDGGGGSGGVEDVVVAVVIGVAMAMAMRVAAFENTVLMEEVVVAVLKHGK